MDILHKVKETIINFNLIRPGELVLAAVSGGPDSLAMLEILYRLQKELDYSLHVIHLNHKLRVEADNEAEFVKEYATRLNIPVTVLEKDISALLKNEGGSLQDLAREVRYQLFLEVAQKIKAQKIALGHHADDLAETVLMRFLRGSGLEGLIGFTAQSRGILIRPLIRLTRQEIENFCHREGLTPCYDISNTKPVYLRNKIRLALIPELEKEYNPNLKAQLVQMAHLLAEENSFIEECAEKAYREVVLDESLPIITFDIDALQQKKSAIIRRIMRIGMEKLKGNKKNIYFQHYLKMEELIAAGSPGKMVHLPDGYLLYRGYKKLKLGPKQKILNQPLKRHLLPIPGQIYLDDLDLLIRAEIVEDRVITTGNKASFDADLLGDKLIIRSRLPGDWFVPLGGKGKKKVKDFLIDKKIDRLEREIIPIVTTINGDIIWVSGYRLDERYKVTSETKRTCILTIQKEGL